MRRTKGEAAASERIRYRLTRLQRVVFVLPMAGVLLGTQIWDWMTWEPSGSQVVTTIGVGVGMPLAVLVASRPFGVTLTPSAAVVHNLRRRTILWTDVQAIRVEPYQGARSVVIYEVGGRRTRPRAPITGFLQWDRGFEEKFHTISRWWLDHHGPDWNPLPPSGAEQGGRAAADGNPVTPPG
ncbi:hypothetical protein [Streptomyces sp. LN785]|uniref:hypothetical protein n=1 Tax=Streptomyces sp. LN785 TaxID=3112983 RepID=UPI0037192182